MPSGFLMFTRADTTFRRPENMFSGFNDLFVALRLSMNRVFPLCDLLKKSYMQIIYVPTLYPFTI